MYQLSIEEWDNAWLFGWIVVMLRAQQLQSKTEATLIEINK